MEYIDLKYLSATFGGGLTVRLYFGKTLDESVSCSIGIRLAQHCGCFYVTLSMFVAGFRVRFE